METNRYLEGLQMLQLHQSSLNGLRAAALADWDPSTIVEAYLHLRTVEALETRALLLDILEDALVIAVDKRV